jgi:beta-lactamase regulating signal transducer with metallopeptidase domain
MNSALMLLNRWGQEWLAVALPMLVQSSVLIAFVLGLEYLLRNRVRAIVRYAVLLLVLVKLALPTSFSLPTGLGYWIGPPDFEASGTQARWFVAVPAANPSAKLSPAPRAGTHLSSSPATSAVAAFPRQDPPMVSMTLPGLLLVGWTAGIGALLTIFFRRWRLVSKLRAETKLPTADEQLIMEQCHRQLGLARRILLRRTSLASCPAVCGLLHPVILLPGRVADELSASELRGVLLHELAHVRRRDLWVNCVQSLLQIVYWWHPLLWLANGRIRLVREEAVDEAVLTALSPQAEEYPETLLRVARLSLREPTLALGSLGIMESRRKLTARIKRMLRQPVPQSSRLGVAGVALVIVMGAVLLPMAHSATKDRPQITANLGPRLRLACEGFETRLIMPDGSLWGGQKDRLERIGQETNWAEIAVSWDHTVALKKDGTLWSWGSNRQGQLGDGTTESREEPAQVGRETDWVAIAVGRTHTVALKRDGSLWTWGSSQFGELGDGTEGDPVQHALQTTPKRVGSDTDWSAISARVAHAHALKKNGSLWGWGWNVMGLLGDETEENRNVPTPIGTDKDWVAVVDANDFTLALKQDGSLWAWGCNGSGQIGDGSTNGKPIPTRVGTDSDWKNIAGGFAHTLGIKRDGSLWTWGLNFYGQLGDGTTQDKWRPLRVGQEADWITASTGEMHTVAAKRDGSVWFWGLKGSVHGISLGTGGRMHLLPGQPLTQPDSEDIVSTPIRLFASAQVQR